jgi:hypothetical protein
MIHLIGRLLRHSKLQFSQRIRVRNQREDTTFWPSEEARQKAGYLSRSIEAKNWE